MRMTAISLPLNAEVIKDREGFEEVSLVEWLECIPANVRDATNKEQTTAYQNGYNVEKVFSILAVEYNGQTFLRDDTDGYIYDVMRAHRVTGSHILLLECERRQRGNGVWGW